MKKYQSLLQDAKAKNEQALALLQTDNPDMTQVDALRNEAKALSNRAEQMKAIEADLTTANTPVMPADLPGDGGDNKATKPDDGVAKAAHVIRYGDIDENVDRIMNEVYGGVGDYRQKAYDQSKAFTRFMRTGSVEGVDRRQLWPESAVKAMIRQGMSVAEIKATQMESSDVLGGYAVPAMVSDRIIQRQSGLSSTRSAGATIVNLTTNSIEMLSITGGNSRYTSGLRGEWGNEIKTPATKNFNFGFEQLPTHVYTYKVPFSQSFIEDAANVVDVFTKLVAETLALDEDEAFLVGTGVNRPQGILPGGANALTLTEVVSASAAALTIGGLKNLRRGVSSQYRGQNATMIGANATGGAIEALADSDGAFYVEVLDPGVTKFLGATWRESEALPAIGAGTYPLIFGDFSGYFIVERLGMSVDRFRDSNTGPNVVEFHIRRRVGGRVIEPWKFAVQKVSAS